MVLLRKLSGARPSSQPWVISPQPGSPGNPSAVPTRLSLFLRNRTCLMRTKALRDLECPDGTPHPSQTVSAPALGPGQPSPPSPCAVTSALCSCQTPPPPTFLGKPGHARAGVAPGRRAVAVVPALSSNSHILTGCRAQAELFSKHKRYGLAFPAPSRKSGSSVCAASVTCSAAVALTKPCAHSPWYLVDLVTPDACPCSLSVRNNGFCWSCTLAARNPGRFCAHQDRRPRPLSRAACSAFMTGGVRACVL